MDEKPGFGTGMTGGWNGGMNGSGNGLPEGAKRESQPSYAESEKAHESLLPFRTNFASVSLHMQDRIRLLRFPLHQVVQVQELIRQSWPKGIQEVRAYDQSQEIKLRGDPWRNYWDADKIDARRLLCTLLKGLFDMGWVLKAAVDISKKRHDKDTMMFRQQTPPPPPCLWMAISFDNRDLMHIMNAPAEFHVSLLEIIGPRVQRSQYLQPTVFEIKFRGYPWQAQGTDTVQQRVYMLNFMECLEQHGFSLYVSTTMDDGPGGDSHMSGSDTWFCNRPADWIPGTPLYH